MFHWFNDPHPIYREWYRYSCDVRMSGEMSMSPTRFEIANAKDIMKLQKEVHLEEDGVNHRSTVNEKRVAEAVGAEQSGDWDTVTAID